MKFLLSFSIMACLLGCTAEQAHEKSVCEQFLSTHTDFVENIRHVECLESNHLYFELLPNKGSIFFATIQGDSIKLDSVWGYDNRVFGKTLDYNSWRNETQPKSLPAFFNREQIKSDSSRYGVRLFSEFRQFIMTADGLDKNKFDEKFNMDDSLINLYNRMAFMNLFSHLDSWIRKKDNQSFFIQSSDGNFYVATTKERRNIAKFKSYTQDDYVPKNELKINSTDSTFLVEYRNHDWFYFNEARDSIDFHVSDSTNAYSVTHYKANGDTVYYIKNFNEKAIVKVKPD